MVCPCPSSTPQKRVSSVRQSPATSSGFMGYLPPMGVQLGPDHVPVAALYTPPMSRSAVR